MTDEPTDTQPIPPTPKAKRPRRTAAQELAYLQQRMARIRAAESKRSRAMQNREKIVIGGAIVKAMRNDPEWQERVVALLRADVTRPADLEAIAPWLSAT